MKKYKIVVIVILLFILGIFSFTISLDGLFFTTKYYKTPISAYNAANTYNAISGDTTVEKELGLVKLDDKTYLFIGELEGDCFIVDEMDVKDGQYASKGNRIIYNLKEATNEIAINYTNTTNGTRKWTVIYNQDVIETLSNVYSVESYMHTCGNVIYFVLFDVDS